MSNMSSTGYSSGLPTEATQLEQLRSMVEQEFEVEDSFMEYGILTFRVRMREDSKKAFLRLVKHLDSVGFTPILRGRNGEVVLQIIRKPSVKPSRRIINLVLLLATIGTTLVSGYLLSPSLVNPLVGAVTFSAALMAILVSHELGHKLVANLHGVESTLPYILPGPPPPFGIGTIGAVIKQNSLAPNKDALFDLGISGPITGFIVTLIVTTIGIAISPVVDVLPPEAGIIPTPLLFDFIAEALVRAGAVSGGPWIILHPVAFAGWVGMLVTMLNLVPTGMLDGGHAVRSLLGEKTSRIVSFLGILILLLLGHFLFAMIAFLFSMQRHPGPLDDVSKPTTSRKIATLALVSIFVLCIAPLWPIV